MKSISENDSSISLTIILSEISMLSILRISGKRDTRTLLHSYYIIFAFSLLIFPANDRATTFQSSFDSFSEIEKLLRLSRIEEKLYEIGHRRSNCLEHAIQPRSIGY